MTFSETRYIAQDNIIDCDLGGERALLNLKSNDYFTMNGTASTIWLSLKEPRSMDDLIDAVTEKFDVAADLCRPDVQRLLAEMLKAGIIDTVTVDAQV
ncbi:PqqD family protein [Marivita sp.]|uniref:PqqD family protein n=1 Tax=Marivita sp. TaxID=2003365 RepID=UPI0025B9AFEC|nr:PqqD family protein [Marivita sp.]